MAAAAAPPLPGQRLPDEAEFERISLTEIGRWFKKSRRRTIEWCRRYGLLATKITCEHCRSNCRPQRKKIKYRSKRLGMPKQVMQTVNKHSQRKLLQVEIVANHWYVLHMGIERRQSQRDAPEEHL